MALITFFFFKKKKKKHLESAFETGLGYKTNLVFRIFRAGERGLHVPIGVCDLLNLKGHHSSPILQLFKEKPEIVKFETHKHDALSLLLSVSVSQPLTDTCTRAVRKQHTRARCCALTHVQRSTQKKKWCNHWS